MTEVWRSNKMHWCDLCKVWMNDNKAAKLNHERGMKHQDNLQRKIREMSRKADSEQKTRETAAKNFERIEQRARKQFEEDQKALEASAGRWTWDESCSYYYNDLHRWYYDPKTRWYYGGEPQPSWVQAPPIPDHALFGTAKHIGGPVPQPSPPPQTGPPAGPQGPGASARPSASISPSPPANAAAAAGSSVAVAAHTRTIELPKHPLSSVGGDWQIKVGRVGAAKGIGLQGCRSVGEGGELQQGHTAGGSSGGGAGDKRKREEGGSGKALSKEEEEFQARREAARQRVAQRTAQNFGYL